MKRFLPLSTVLLLVACHKAPDTTHLREAAQYYLEQGGLSLHPEYAYSRPCLKPTNMKETLVGGAFGISGRLVDFIDKHHLAKVQREQRSSGYEAVTLTPLKPYEANWLGEGDTRLFCFGRLELTKVEPVADAKAITAGEAEPYIIAGTQARSTRITFKLTDLPPEPFAQDLEEDHTLLQPGSMLPADYNREFTVVATLPEKVENFKAPP